jgi:tetratricopeptide (TPR) repeat protein
MFRGRRYYRRKSYSDALRYFEKTTNKGSASSVTLAHVGFCLAKLNRYGEAIEVYQRALQGNVENGQVHAQLSEVYSDMERYQEAYDSLHRAFRAKPKLQQSSYYLHRLGNICLKLERWEESRDSYGKALEQQSNEELWIGLGISLKNLNRSNDALDAFRKSTETTPNKDKVWHWLGWMYAQLNRDYDPIVPLQRAIQLEPANASAHRELADCYFKLKNFREAAACYQQYVALKADEPAGYYSLAMAHCELREFALAVKPLLKALDIGPKFGEVYGDLGSVYSELKEFENAVEAYQNATRLEPNCVRHYCGLAAAYLSLDKRKEASEAARESLRLDSGLADGYLLLGCSLHEPADLLRSSVLMFWVATAGITQTKVRRLSSSNTRWKKLRLAGLIVASPFADYSMWRRKHEDEKTQAGNLMRYNRLHLSPLSKI